MKKLMTAALAAAMLLFLTACSAEKQAGDYPAAIMADGSVYQMACQTLENADSSAILGYTTAYTETWPEEDGETNFSRTLGLPYARCEGGIAVYCDGAWQLFTLQE